MAKPKPKQIKKQIKNDTLARQRLYKRRHYAKIKNDPELLAIAKEKRRALYLKAKEANKIKSISEQPLRKQREQRKKWKENSRRYRQNKKKKKMSFQEIFVETNGEQEDENILTNHIKEEPGLQEKQDTAAKIKKIRLTELNKRNKLLVIIKNLKKRDKVQSQQIQRLKKLLDKQTKLLDKQTKLPDKQTKLPDKQKKEQINEKPEDVYILVVK